MATPRRSDEIDWSKPVYMTEEEYLAFEEASDEKHEFDDGLVIPLGRINMMSGGTIPHSRTIALTLTAVNLALRGSGCIAYDSNLAVKSRNDTRYSYPDVSIICGEVEGDPAGPDRIANNPVCVIEVLSAGTARYDATDKFEKYARIESLREYAMFDALRPSVQTLYRDDDGRWIFDHFSGRDKVVPLRSVGVSVSLSDVYPDEPAAAVG